MSNYTFLIYLQKKEQFFISGMKIIHAKTCNLLGCCEVTYGDGTTDILTKTIGELYEELNATVEHYSAYLKALMVLIGIGVVVYLYRQYRK